MHTTSMLVILKVFAFTEAKCFVVGVYFPDHLNHSLLISILSAWQGKSYLLEFLAVINTLWLCGSKCDIVKANVYIWQLPVNWLKSHMFMQIANTRKLALYAYLFVNCYNMKIKGPTEKLSLRILLLTIKFPLKWYHRQNWLHFWNGRRGFFSEKSPLCTFFTF